MKVAIYGRPIKFDIFKEFFENLTSGFERRDITFHVIDNYASFLADEYNLNSISCKPDELIKNQYDYLISLGGDGTVLDTLALVKDSGIPVVGINLGRLGFLASIQMSECDIAIEAMVEKKLVIEKRSVLQLVSDNTDINTFPYALNDFVVQKRDSSAMITVDTYLNDDFLNSYWADGLIIATPTGSSGYSMSCGGPLLFPGSNAFVVTPIAAHNLTVRPAVIADSNQLQFKISGRSDTVLVSLDSRSFHVPSHSKLAIKKANFTFSMARLKGITYMDTIRNKLMWGMDSRNKTY